MEENLYFLAIIPPEPIHSEVMQIKKYFETHHRSKGALRSPPHITLHMPFRWKEKKENSLINILSEFYTSIDPFNISLENFECFSPRVIFIDVQPNEKLTILQKELTSYVKKNLKLLNANYKSRPFHPHITVAFRDLRKPEFHKAWEKFQHEKYSSQFECAQFELLKHDGQKWNPFKTFKLMPKNQ